MNVRYLRDFRSDLGAPRPRARPGLDGQRQIPLGELAEIKLATGPAMIRNEDGLLTGYVYVDVAGRDLGGYVSEAKRAAARPAQAAARLRARVERPVRSHGSACASG